MEYELVVCGGTFDLLHQGHKTFLQEILKISNEVVIGLTSDKYVIENKPDRGIAPFKIRREELLDFAKEIGANKKMEVIKIDNMYGPLLNPNFKADALVVASDKYDSALIINNERKNRGILPIKVIKIPIVRAQDNKVLSATRIREGYINRKGKLLLPSKLRKKLQKPLGKLLNDIPENLVESKIITVGDVTTDRFISKSYNPRLSIVDFRVGRKPIPHKEFKNMKTIKADNRAGTISFELSNAIKKSFEDSISKVIIVDGEEDLSVLPAIIFSPLGFEIYYGQPGQGLVQVKVTKKIKEKTYKLLNDFILG